MYSFNIYMYTYLNEHIYIYYFYILDLSLNLSPQEMGQLQHEGGKRAETFQHEGSAGTKREGRDSESGIQSSIQIRLEAATERPILRVGDANLRDKVSRREIEEESER